MKQNIEKDLRMIRKYRNLTLRELGEKTGIQHGRLCKFESGNEVPTDENFKKIEKALNVNLKEYFEISSQIDQLFNEFLDSLFYYDNNYEYYKSKISAGKKANIINYELGKAQLIEYIIFVLEKDFEQAKLIEDDLLEYFSRDFSCESILYQYKGLMYRMEKRYNDAILCFERAKSESKNEKNEAMLYLHSSIAYKRTGIIAKAMQYIKSALNIFSEYGSVNRLTFCLVEYALLLKATHQYDLAMSYFKRALRAMEVINCSNDLFARVYRNMCWTMILVENYQAALEYLEEAKSYDSKHSFTALYGIWCHYKLKNYEEAEKIIINNTHLIKDAEYADIYKLFDMLVKCRESIPRNSLINHAANIVNDMKDVEDYERVNFYIDIVLDLLNRNGNELREKKYLKMKINSKTKQFVSKQDSLSNF